MQSRGKRLSEIFGWNGRRGRQVDGHPGAIPTSLDASHPSIFTNDSTSGCQDGRIEAKKRVADDRIRFAVGNNAPSCFPGRSAENQCGRNVDNGESRLPCNVHDHRVTALDLAVHASDE